MSSGFMILPFLFLSVPPFVSVLHSWLHAPTCPAVSPPHNQVYSLP